MKKLLLILSLIVLPVTGAISWNQESKTYYSTNHFWSDTFDKGKYNVLACIANECIATALLMDSEYRCAVLKNFIAFLMEEGSPESLVLLLDLNEIFEIYYDAV